MGNRKPESRLEVCYYDEDGYLETKSSYPLAGKIAPIEVYAAAPDLYDALDLALAAINDLYRERAHDGHCSLSEARQLYGNDGAVLAGRAALRKARGE
jgi:hypothetical protein